MNSSGIKRGLAASAIAALAVAGLPLFASSASANTGEEMSFVVAGPTRDSVDAAAIGGFVVLKTKGITLAEAQNATTGVKAIGSDLSSPANNANQTVEVNLAGIQFMADGTTNPFGGADGFDEIYVPVKVDTAATGGTATYALYVDNGDGTGPGGANSGTVQAIEARAQVTQSTAGAPASITVAPATQSAPNDAKSGNYVATVKDSAGRTTQTLGAGEDITLVTDADERVGLVTTPATAEAAYGDDVVVPPAVISQQGTFTFTARANTDGAHTIAIDGPGAVDASAALTVTPAVTGLTVADLDVVTGADTWDGFGGGAFGVAESVRVDQGTIKLDVADDAGAAGTNDNATMSVTFTGTGGVTFDGGKATKTVTVTLDAAAKGSVEVTPDAASINENGGVNIDSAAFNGGGQIQLTFDRATATTVVADAQAYNTKIGQSTSVTVTAKDQYGNPVAAPAQVSITRSGRAANAGTTARQTVNAQGQATFTLADAGTTAGTENLELNLFDDQFDATATTTVLSPDAVINYSVEGTGPNYTVTGATSDPAATTFNPLYDTNADIAGTEYELISIDGGTANGSATVTVDGGALVLTGADDDLNKGAASKTVALDGAGDGSFKVIGTKHGDVTVTIVSGGITKTVKVRVVPSGAITVARNIEVEAPEKAAANDVVAITATITDNWGNPVAGLVSGVNVIPLLTGPAEILSSSGPSNAAGEIVYQVQLSNSANSPVTLTVQGTGAQFGASANYLTDADDNGTPTPAPNAPGLAASANPGSDTISDVVNIEELEQAVEEAQAKVDAAQDNLDDARGDLQVAKAEKQVAQADVKAAKKDLKKAKKKGKGVKAAQAALRDAKGDLKVAQAKVDSAQAKVDRAKERLADAQAELEAAEQELEDAQS